MCNTRFAILEALLDEAEAEAKATDALVDTFIANIEALRRARHFPDDVPIETIAERPFHRTSNEGPLDRQPQPGDHIARLDPEGATAAQGSLGEIAAEMRAATKHDSEAVDPETHADRLLACYLSGQMPEQDYEYWHQTCPVFREMAEDLFAKRREAESAATTDTAAALQQRVDELEALINHPHNDDWFEGVRIEAAHQVERYPPEHDAGKSPADWFWTFGYLAQKAMTAAQAGDTDKALHHTISTAALLLNWHRHLKAAADGATAEASSYGGGSFQDRVQPWLLMCFGRAYNDPQERNHRFLEEALELVQAGGCMRSEAYQLVNYVYGRPKGEVRQEIGGVMLTLAALCLSRGEDMHVAGEAELARVWTKIDEIRAKQAAKPKHSPLPGPTAGEVAS